MRVKKMCEWVSNAIERNTHIKYYIYIFGQPTKDIKKSKRRNIKYIKITCVTTVSSSGHDRVIVVDHGPSPATTSTQRRILRQPPRQRHCYDVLTGMFCPTSRTRPRPTAPSSHSNTGHPRGYWRRSQVEWKWKWKWRCYRQTFRRCGHGEEIISEPRRHRLCSKNPAGCSLCKHQ